jgi:hypothetical protein
MLPFRALFDDLAKEETRVLHVAHGQDLPEGAYLFMEAFCTEPGCDCRRVLIQVLHAETKRQVATINYAFEPSKPPFNDEPQVFLDPMNPQSEHSDRLQDAFETLMLTDTAYVTRLHRHYDMWKRVVDDPKHPDHAKVCPPGRPDYGGPAFPKKPVRRESPKIGPNELCPCGSGKKFKKCCMGKAS